VRDGISTTVDTSVNPSMALLPAACPAVVSSREVQSLTIVVGNVLFQIKTGTLTSLEHALTDSSKTVNYQVTVQRQSDDSGPNKIVHLIENQQRSGIECI
jgi:hypothetical protein